ncbi:MAG: hypothetical protein RIC30_09515 [Marinoscillum sp.]|uniref:hypothetical protein n=1 Tax=Marinoscillum sp. TaxID=2024838 RepID=UPI0032FD8DF8
MKDILNLILAIILTWISVAMAVTTAPLWLIYTAMMAYEEFMEGLFPGLQSDYMADMWVEKGGANGY